MIPIIRLARTFTKLISPHRMRKLRQKYSGFKKKFTFPIFHLIYNQKLRFGLFSKITSIRVNISLCQQILSTFVLKMKISRTHLSIFSVCKKTFHISSIDHIWISYMMLAWKHAFTVSHLSACNIMFIIIWNGFSNLSSNHGWGGLNFAWC